MTWFFYALLAPMLWAVVNHFDKFIISRYVKHGGDPGSTILLSGFAGVAVSIIVLIIAPQSVHTNIWLALGIILNGALLTAAYIPYLYALGADETSVVAPLFQLITLFVYILGVIFLREALSISQIFAGLLIVIGAMIISFERKEGSIKIKYWVVALMVLSSFLIAINSVLFKTLAEHTNFWTTAFWEYLGASLFALSLFTFLPRYRNEFLRIVRTNGIKVIGLNIAGELISASARLSFNFAALLVPIALVSIVNGFQPIFILAYGTALTVLVPHITKENISRRFLLQKSIAIVFMILGTILLIGM